MSYSRFGADGSDVYTFPSDRGLECCACPLGGFFTTRDVAEFAAHLDAHRAAGHAVPDDIMPAILGDLPWLLSDGIIAMPPCDTTSAAAPRKDPAP